MTRLLIYPAEDPSKGINMPIININNLTFGYDGSEKVLFDDISIVLDTSWKLALAGRNGRGKTTLFKLLRGELPYSGSITGIPETVIFRPHYLTEQTGEKHCVSPFFLQYGTAEAGFVIRFSC